GRSHVLNSGNCIASDQFEACFKQQFFLEWIADLHRRAVLPRLLSQFAGGKRCAGETVTTRFSADVKNGISRAFRGAAGELIVPQYAEAKNVYQRIAIETLIEINLAADCGDADAVAVMRDTRDDTREEPPVGGNVRWLLSDV